MIDIEVEDPSWTEALPNVEALVAEAVRAVFEFLPRDAQQGGGVEVGRGAAGAPSVTRSSASATSPVVFATGEELVIVLLADDAAVADLNSRFRGKDGPTNVLSFPAPENPEGLLGDIALAFGVCAREAHEQGKTLEHHLQHLVAHGVLHLLGYDHMSDEEADVMEGLERIVLAGLGVSDPYAAGEGDHD